MCQVRDEPLDRAEGGDAGPAGVLGATSLAEGAQTDLWRKLARLVEVASIYGDAERQACGKTGTSP